MFVKFLKFLCLLLFDVLIHFLKQNRTVVLILTMTKLQNQRIKISEFLLELRNGKFFWLFVEDLTMKILRDGQSRISIWGTNRRWRLKDTETGQLFKNVMIKQDFLWCWKISQNKCEYWLLIILQATQI